MEIRLLLAIFAVVHYVDADLVKHLIRHVTDERYQKWIQGPDVYVPYLGYEFEWHEFITHDGVTIKMFHIWKGNSNVTGIPVLLQPTLLTNGNIWLTCEPEDCFALLLADCGYDIWITNYRGSRYGSYKRKHTSFTIDDSIREDLPRAIDYVLKKTKREDLHVVSYSKSTTVTFGLLSTQTEYNDKVRIHIAITPVTYFEDTLIVVKLLFAVMGYITQRHIIPPWCPSKAIAIFDTNFFFKPFRNPLAGIVLAKLTHKAPWLLRLGLNTLSASRVNLNPVRYDNNFTAMGLYNGIAEVMSHHELHHYAQATCAKQFQSFDYSCVPKKYRRNFPVMVYDMSRITAPTILLEASLELFSQPEDHRRIRSQHKNLLGAYLVNLPNFMHIDGLVGKNRNGVFGRAFVQKMLEFDGDEMQSCCHFNFAQESRYLRKMQVNELAEVPPQHGLGKLITKSLIRILNPVVKDYCKYYTCATKKR